MMGTEDKTLLCFCHWGRNTKVLPDGSISYVGGITCQVIAKTGIKYNDFVNAVFDRLGIIDPSNKMLHYTVKFDSSQLIQLRDQEDVNTLLQFNDGFAHVYASSLEKEPYSRPSSSGVKKVGLIVDSNSKPDTTPAGDDDIDMASPLKKVRFQSAGDSKPQQKEAVGSDGQKHAGVTRPCSNYIRRLTQNGVGLPEGNVQNNNSKIRTVNEQASRQPSGGTIKVELVVHSDSEPDAIPDSNPQEMHDYPYPEFSDFEKHRPQSCFAVDQIWACHGADFMPRLYAHIRKVSGPEFKIKLSWLEAHPEDESERAWVRADFPVACGKFRRGSSEYTSDLLIFSHQVQCEKDERGMYIVYPRKGEMWALFRDWDIDWSSDPKNHRMYKYEVVEILSDFVGDVGIQVGYLDKVTGFVGIFQRTRLPIAGTFFVKPSEPYKFSHRIPSKMSGTEREGVPAGSFELDPACLPLNPDDIWYPGKVKEDRKTAKSAPAENVLSAGPPVTRDKSRNEMTSLKSGDLNDIHGTDGESSKVRRSLKGVNISKKKGTLMSSRSANNSPYPEFFDKIVKKSCYSSSSLPVRLSCQNDRGFPSRIQSFSLNNSSGSSKNPIALSDKGFEVVVCDFKMERYMRKFQVDQVWALYGQDSALPKTYGQIKMIISAPLELHVALLEACAWPKSAAQSVCGTFKVQNGKCQVYAPSSFSHVVKAVSINRNMFEIYPREGEIWALYKNWNKSGLDPDKSEYEIVEVIKNSKDRIKVSPLVHGNGFKSVVGSPESNNIQILLF